MTIKIHAERQMFDGNIVLRMMTERAGVRQVAMPVCFTQAVEGMLVQPMMQLDVTEAQSLMDQLWHCGLRPSEGSGSAGSLAATERHLADMKTIAFHALKVQP